MLLSWSEPVGFTEKKVTSYRNKVGNKVRTFFFQYEKPAHLDLTQAIQGKLQMIARENVTDI